MESSFLNVLRGNRLSSMMGLKLEEGVAPKMAKDYSYVEVPALELVNPSETKVVEKALRNQQIRVVPACALNVKGQYKVLVEPNPDLWEYGTVQSSYYIHPDSGVVVPAFYMILRKDMELSDLAYAVRLYLRA